MCSRSRTNNVTPATVSTGLLTPQIGSPSWQYENTGEDKVHVPRGPNAPKWFGSKSERAAPKSVPLNFGSPRYTDATMVPCRSAASEVTASPTASAPCEYPPTTNLVPGQTVCRIVI